MGSVLWMSPEQASGESSSVGPASDLYSLGIMLFEQLQGDAIHSLFFREDVARFRLLMASDTEEDPFEVLAAGRVRPVNGAVAVNRLDGMPLRAYTVDAVGLTLWRDGFGGTAPAVIADLTFHAIVVQPQAPVAPERLF